MWPFGSSQTTVRYYLSIDRSINRYRYRYRYSHPELIFTSSVDNIAPLRMPELEKCSHPRA